MLSYIFSRILILEHILQMVAVVIALIVGLFDVAIGETLDKSTWLMCSVSYIFVVVALDIIFMMAFNHFEHRLEVLRDNVKTIINNSLVEVEHQYELLKLYGTPEEYEVFTETCTGIRDNMHEQFCMLFRLRKTFICEVLYMLKLSREIDKVKQEYYDGYNLIKYREKEFYKKLKEYKENTNV